MQQFTASDAQALPQSVISLKPDNGLQYNSTSGQSPVIDFTIPQTLGYMVAEDTTLSFDFTYTTTDGVVYNVRPQQAGGIGSMIRQIDIYSLDGVLLEQIQDYHIINNCLMSHNNGADEELQDGLFNRLSLTEAYTRDNQTITPFKTPNVLPSSPTTPITNQAYQEQKIELKIRLSYLLGGDKVVPLAAIGGLRVRFQLNNIELFTIKSGQEVDNLVRISKPLATSAAPWIVNNTNNEMTCTQAAQGGYLITPGVNNIVHGPDSQQTLTAGYYKDQADLIAMVQPFLDLAFVPATTSLQMSAGAGINDFDLTGAVAPSPVGANDTFLSATNFFDTGTLASYPVGVTAMTTATAIGTNSAFIANGAYSSANLVIAVNNAFDALCSAGVVVMGAIAGSTLAGWTTTLTCATAARVQPLAGVAVVPVDGTTGIMNWPGATTFPGPGTLDNANASTGVPVINNYGDVAVVELSQRDLYCVNPKDFNTCPFVLGQSLLVAGSTVASPPITNFSISANGDVQVEFSPLSWQPNVAIPADAAITQNIDPTSNLQYQMKNVALNIPIITPPPSYVKALIGAMEGAEGLRIDMKVFNLVRSVVQVNETMSALNLPFNATTRAKGLISIPHIVSNGSFDVRYAADNFNMLRLTKYFYEYYGVKHPERAIDTDRCRLGSLSQELLQEQVKAFEYCLDKVQCLNGWEDAYNSKTFFVGRNLGLFNSTCDLRNANVALTLEATSTAGGAANIYNIDTFCRCINSVVCRPTGVVLLQ